MRLRTTACISNSVFEEDVFTETFWAGKPMLRLGHARNDVFFPEFDYRRAELKRAFIEKYELEEDVRFVLYAPTFRDSHNFAVYDLDAERTVSAFTERFGGQWKLLVRYHYNDVKNEAKKNIEGQISLFQMDSMAGSDSGSLLDVGGKLPDVKPFTKEVSMSMEKEMLGV